MHAISNWHTTWARFRPDAEAIFDAGTGRRWTWAELNRDALVWAERLRREGVRQGDRVAVLAWNRGETLALLFAVAELGAILFPMNWRLAPEELKWQFDHCTPRAIVADRHHAPTAGLIASLETALLVFEQRPDVIAEDFAGGPGSRGASPAADFRHQPPAARHHRRSAGRIAHRQRAAGAVCALGRRGPGAHR